MRVKTWVFGVLLFAAAAGADEVATLSDQINAAHKAGDYAAMEDDTLQLLKLLPNHPRLYYLLALAQTHRGEQAAALQALGRMADVGAYADLAATPDFAPLKSTPGWSALVSRFAALRRPVGHAEAGFRLAEPDFIPEGVAHDPVSGDFFVSSVHLRKIVRVHAGKEMPFADRSTGLWGVMGMKVDTQHGSLWAASSAMPEIEGYADSLAGKSALFRFDLRTGKLLASYPPPADGAEHQFNDVALGPDGSVYTADGDGGVYVLDPGAAALRLLTPPGALHSAQGMAVSSDGRLLYVADYAVGLYAYSFRDRSLTRLAVPADVYTYYIDGLGLHGRDLVVVQNALDPQRVERFRLDASGLKIVGAETLSASDPQAPEPTLLAVAGDQVYFVADSQWSRYDEHHQLPPKDQLQKPLVLKVALPK